MQRFDEAVTAYEHCIAISVELADHYEHALVLEKLGEVHAELGHPEPARRAWAQAIELYTTGDAEDDAERVRRRSAGLPPERRRWWRR